MDLKNKTVAFLGDSITEGVGTSGPAFRYDTLVANALGLKAALNYGISGTRLAHQKKPSAIPQWDLCFCGRAYRLDPSADLIVVFGGVNDYGHGDAPFGTMEDQTPETFCGAVDFLMRKLPELYPHSKVAFLAPMRCKGWTGPSWCPFKGPNDQTLVEYVQVILDKGKQYGIPVLNTLEKLSIDPSIPEDAQAYFPDGMHPNDEGHALLAQVVLEFLKTL